mgnify:CR=1 FL=1
MATIPRELSEDQLSSESETGSGPAAPRHLPQHGDQRGACEGFATSIAGTSTLLKGQSTGSALPQRSDAEATLIVPLLQVAHQRRPESSFSPSFR